MQCIKKSEPKMISAVPGDIATASRQRQCRTLDTLTALDLQDLSCNAERTRSRMLWPVYEAEEVRQAAR